jgi:hypothetical protein
MRHMVSGKFYWQAHEKTIPPRFLHMVLNHYHINHKTITIYALAAKFRFR